MFSKKLNIGSAVLLIVNLIPLFGVWFQGWDPRQMFLVYCMETIIIGGYNILKMLLVTFYKKEDEWEYNNGKTMVSGIFFIVFFIFHYGLFVFIQTAMFTAISGLSTYSEFGPLTFLGSLFSYLTFDTKIVLYFFIIMYGIRMVTDFVITGKYKQASLGVLMFQPYIRIFIQQFVVIIGSIFLSFGAGRIFMLVFVCIKVYFEIFIDEEKFLQKGESIQKMNEMLDKKFRNNKSH